MITEPEDPQERSNDRATLAWSLLVSTFLNLMGCMLIAWTVASRTHAMTVAENPPQETFIVSSSSMRIVQPSRPVQQQPVRQAPTQQRRPEPRAEPTEIARITPNAPPQPRSAPRRMRQATLAETLAQQQVAFEHEAQQLNQQHGPIAIATIDPSQRAPSMQTYHITFGGDADVHDRGQGFYHTLKAWIDPADGQHCYYIQYQWDYPTGGTEVADVPWPFCYPPTADLIGRGFRSIPMQLPPDGYKLPAGTDLYPIEKEAYEAWLHGNPR
jgi:hypothetical protein